MNTALPKHNGSASVSRLETDRCLVFQQPEELGSRYEQFTAQRTTGAQFAALDQPVDAEVIDPEQIGRFLNGIREPLRFWRRRLRRQ